MKYQFSDVMMATIGGFMVGAAPLLPFSWLFGAAGCMGVLSAMLPWGYVDYVKKWARAAIRCAACQLSFYPMAKETR